MTKFLIVLILSVALSWNMSYLANDKSINNMSLFYLGFALIDAIGICSLLIYSKE